MNLCEGWLPKGNSPLLLHGRRAADQLLLCLVRVIIGKGGEDDGEGGI